MEVCIILAARVISAKEFTAFTVRKQIAVLPVAVGIVLTALNSENVLIVTRKIVLSAAPEQGATIIAVPTKSGVITVLKMEML